MDYTHADEYWRFHTTKAERMDVTLYLKLIEIFCETGEMAGRGVIWPEDKPWLEYDDPLMKYLTQLMSKPEIKVKVLSSKMCANIFYASVGRFVINFIKHRKFSVQRQWTERKKVSEAATQWNVELPGEEDFNKAWQTLLQEIDSRHSQDGFDRSFHEHQFNDSHQGESDPVRTEEDLRRDKWEKMVDDWAKALDEQVNKEDERYINSNNAQLGERLKKQFDDVTSYLKRNDIDQERAVQAWKMMDGHWSESEFERQMRIVKIQDSYPQLSKVVNLMGRVPDSGGRDRMGVVCQHGLKIDHSAGSDIEGITMGKDIHSLLPSEMAMYMDDDMENVFLYKYVRQSLQTFRYRSNIAKPIRKLSFQHASRSGPMIVCVDTSASMFGVPQRIIRSALSLIESTAERLRRNCFLIDFSVSTRAIDLKMRSRMQQYEKLGFSPKEYNFEIGDIPFIGGGTDAQNMMDLLFCLLEKDTNYVNADVLWMSDFLIPEPPASYMLRMKDFRSTGTRFYAMEIMPEGSDKSKWENAFDKMFRIGYQIVRRY